MHINKLHLLLSGCLCFLPLLLKGVAQDSAQGGHLIRAVASTDPLLTSSISQESELGVRSR